MTRTRQNDRLRNALSLLLCLQQVSTCSGRPDGILPPPPGRRVAARRPGLEGRAALGTHWARAPLCRTARSSGVLHSFVVHEQPLETSVHAGSLAVTTRHGPRTDGVADTSDPIPPSVGDCGPRSGCQWGQVLGRPRGSQTAPSDVSSRGHGWNARSSLDTLRKCHPAVGAPPWGPHLLPTTSQGPTSQQPAWGPSLHVWTLGDTVHHSWLPWSAPPQGRGTFGSGSPAVQGQEETGGRGHGCVVGGHGRSRCVPRASQVGGVSLVIWSGKRLCCPVGLDCPPGAFMRVLAVSWASQQ